MSAEATFWNKLAEKYAAQPVKDVAAFERKQAITRAQLPGGAREAWWFVQWVPYAALITLLRWFGKAPLVYLYTREAILRELREAGFVEVEEKDVGASRLVAFIVARKPTQS